MNKFFLFIAFVLLSAFTYHTQPVEAGGGQLGWTGSSGSPDDFLVEVAKGNVPGHSVLHKFGHADVATTYVAITNALTYQTPITAVALEVLSSDADDTSAGVGAQTVYIEGLALDGSIVQQTVALNGLTAVSIPTPLWRLYRWYVASSGVYATTATASHQGTITIRVASAGATWSTLDLDGYGRGQSEIGWYTVPAGKRAFIFAAQIKVDSIKSVDVMLMQRQGANDVTTPFTPIRLVNEFIGVSGSGTQITASPTGAYPAFTDIGFLGKVTAGTGDITVDFEILLIDDGY